MVFLTMFLKRRWLGSPHSVLVTDAGRALRSATVAPGGTRERDLRIPRDLPQRQCRHSALQMLTPIEFEQRQGPHRGMRNPVIPLRALLRPMPYLRAGRALASDYEGPGEAPQPSSGSSRNRFWFRSCRSMATSGVMSSMSTRPSGCTISSGSFHSAVMLSFL